jgi:hypothetical protein
MSVALDLRSVDPIPQAGGKIRQARGEIPHSPKSIDKSTGKCTDHPAVNAKHEQQRGLDPIVVFTARAEARALLWRVGEFSLCEAVDVLQQDAVRDGLVDEIGQDRVQAIMADAFHRWREAVR